MWEEAANAQKGAAAKGVVLIVSAQTVQKGAAVSEPLPLSTPLAYQVQLDDGVFHSGLFLTSSKWLSFNRAQRCTYLPATQH